MTGRSELMRWTAAAIVLLVVLAEGAGAAPLMLSGSSTMQKRVFEPAQKAIEKKTGVTLDIVGAGTIRGLKDLMTGNTGAAISDCPLALAFQETGAPTEGTYKEHVIAQDQVVAIVNGKNKMKKLTHEQLADIHSGRITNWKQLGGADEHIVVVIPPQTSGTRSVIQDTIMEGAAFVERPYVTVTDREALEVVAKFPSAIALLSETFVKGAKGVKVVSTPPLKRQLSIITKNEPPGELAKVIQFLQSREAKKLFR